MLCENSRQRTTWIPPNCCQIRLSVFLLAPVVVLAGMRLDFDLYVRRVNYGWKIVPAGGNFAMHAQDKLR